MDMTESMGIQDKAEAEIVNKIDKPYQSPADVIELTRRRELLPDKWYPLALRPGWQHFLRVGCTMKVVTADGGVLTGIVEAIEMSPPMTFCLRAGSVLLDGGLSDWTTIPRKAKHPIVQAFTGDPIRGAIARAIQRGEFYCIQCGYSAGSIEEVDEHDCSVGVIDG